MATLEEEYKNYQQTQNTDQINSMYDAQKQSQLAGLESAYNQSMSNAQAARDAIPQQYQARANDLATQYERQRRNLNQQAAANGLNTGAGSQMHLALGSNYNRDYGNIRTAQQQALDTADRGIRDLQSAYQSQVQQAVANNDYERAQALLAEYKNQYQRQLQQAQTLASYGDFSAYLNIPGYSQGQVDNMRNAWIASNPQLAYNTGAISADQYYQMTGKWPAGYTQPGAGGYTPGYTPKTPKTPEAPESGSLVGSISDALAGTAPAVMANPYNPLVAAAGAAGGIAAGVVGHYTGAGNGNNAANGQQQAQANRLPYIGIGTGSGPYYRARNFQQVAATDAENYLRQMLTSGQITEEQANQIRRGG